MTKHLKEVERLRKIIEAFPKVTITVLGDLVADEFVYGEISRVSREAPVLILKHRERTVLPGGGANAVNMYVDRDIDDRMARTRRRPIPSGRMGPTAVLAFGILLSTAATAMCAATCIGSKNG